MSTLKTKTFHSSCMGSFAPAELIDSEGYITVHDWNGYCDESYDGLMAIIDICGGSEDPDDQLYYASALVELACREVDFWRSAR